jgi:hypothetical protein
MRGYGYVSGQRSKPVIVRVSGDCTFQERGESGILKDHARDVRDSNIGREDLDQERRSVIVAQELEQGVDVGQA